MQLRSWQTRCITRALKAYRAGQRHFLAVATPGAGKTVMASALADRLFKDGKIELVVCLTPSQAVKMSFADDLSALTRRSMSGGLGSHGCVITYQSLRYHPQQFWQLFHLFKVLVIFDEIHHCGGGDDTPGNAWGEAVLDQIHDLARYTLSLSGTPWRSDELPVAFARYGRPEGRLEPDFVYSLQQAIQEGVCRLPQIVVIDNDGIEVRKPYRESEPTTVYHGIQQLFAQEDLPYQTLLDNSSLLSHVLLRAISQLKLVQSSSPSAAGLVVASTVEHARAIHDRLTTTYGQSAVLITHKSENAPEQLNAFKNSQDNWIVSVGMVSEGTNIPRLQVCCHLSRVKTELHFRQVLGRILRASHANGERAYMFILADFRLVQYARRVADDLPEEVTAVTFESVAQPIEVEHDSPLHVPGVVQPRETPVEENPLQSASWNEGSLLEPHDATPTAVDPCHHTTASLSLFGQFMEELITLQAGFRAP